MEDENIDITPASPRQSNQRTRPTPAPAEETITIEVEETGAGTSGGNSGGNTGGNQSTEIRTSSLAIDSYCLNISAETSPGGIESGGTKYTFPGNIAPEGYFYSPFYEITLKELEDELTYVQCKRINFNYKDTGTTTITTEEVETYNPETGAFSSKTLYLISLISPLIYDFIEGRPFCIYDILEDMTYRGYLRSFSKDGVLEIATETEIDEEGLNEGRYIIAMLEENAPIYAEYLPSTNRMVWRGVKKMSDLASTSPLYNMPFTNGRHYIHRNINVFVRRQDPHNDYGLFRPAPTNPLRRFQVEGDAKLDFDYIQYIIDSMVDAC